MLMCRKIMWGKLSAWELCLLASCWTLLTLLSLKTLIWSQSAWNGPFSSLRKMDNRLNINHITNVKIWKVCLVWNFVTWSWNGKLAVHQHSGTIRQGSAFWVEQLLHLLESWESACLPQWESARGKIHWNPLWFEKWTECQNQASLKFCILLF